MDAMLDAAFRPFALFAMLLVAWPIKRAIQLYMRDGRLKRALLFRLPQRVVAFERFDAWAGRSLLRLFNALFRPTKLK